MSNLNMTIEIDFQPIGRRASIAKGKSILEAARSAGIGLLATCGGQFSCGSCVVQIMSGGGTNNPNSIEKEHLTLSELESGYRLACQTRLIESAIINIPPQSLSTLQRLQVEGEDQRFELDPRVQVIDLLMPPSFIDNIHDISNFIGGEIKKRLQYHVSDINQAKSALAKKIATDHDGRIRLICDRSALISIHPPDSPALGLAVDIGTTKIAGYLVDLITGETLSKQGCVNPQTAYGDDVMARITYALSCDNGPKTLQEVVIGSINQLTDDLCHSARNRTDNAQKSLFYHHTSIVDAVLVGNTAMHHIFLGLPLKQLGCAPYVPAVSDEMDLPGSDLGMKLSPEASVHLLPNVAGFVGADHVSMLLSAGILNESQNTLYIDIGTNTEITLLVDKRMLCCSTASGPAFEGAHIRDGMRAAKGAIEQIRIEDQKIHVQTIQEAPPVGICGSGIIDGIAQLLKSEIIDRRGAFVKDHPLVRKGENGMEIVLVPAEKTGHGKSITLSRKDISEIQLAKGAIRAGLELMLTETGTDVSVIEQVIVAGAFGSFINIKSARDIGLFPDLDVSNFKQIGNAAGMGAKHSLLSQQKMTESTVIANKLEYIELAVHTGFTEIFARAMMFEPGPLKPL